MPTIGIAKPFSAIYAGDNLVSGGFVTEVTFDKDELSKEELEYACLVAHGSDFFQLVRTAVYMNEGLTFKEATIKYLKEKQRVKTNI